LEQYITRTYTDAEGVDHEMLEVQFPDLGPPTGERWYVCMACGQPFRRADVVLVNGNPYCFKNECAKHKNEERSPSTPTT
jgi:formylmethanofuran dehydrogenase subunit E